MCDNFPCLNWFGAYDLTPVVGQKMARDSSVANGITWPLVEGGIDCFVTSIAVPTRASNTQPPPRNWAQLLLRDCPPLLSIHKANPKRRGPLVRNK